MGVSAIDIIGKIKKERCGFIMNKHIKFLTIVLIIIILLLTGCATTITITEVTRYDSSYISFKNVSGIPQCEDLTLSTRNFTEECLDKIVRSNIKVGSRVKVTVESISFVKITDVELVD